MIKWYSSVQIHLKFNVKMKEQVRLMPPNFFMFPCAVCFLIPMTLTKCPSLGYFYLKIS